MKSTFLAIIFICVGFYFYSFSFFATLFAISFLIFFHELGHFLAARMFGVKVNVFSVGFGEKIFTKNWRGTDYCISAIPLGGYVQLKGQDDTNPNLKNFDPDSYNILKPIQRIVILFAGPFFNLFLAFLIYIWLGFLGVEKLAPIIGNIMPNSAASEINLKQNDEILEINGVKILEWDQISKNLLPTKNSLKIKRDNEILNLSITPKIGITKNMFGEEIKKPLIGISPNNKFVTIYHTGFSSLQFALDESIAASKLILVGLEKLLTGIVSPREMGGIVAITDISSKAFGISLVVFLNIVALISINLGLINLFPIPVLDGGHIVFNLYEMIFKRKIPQKIFSGLNYAGMAMLFGLMAFTIINDFLRIFGI